jgi:hypothetical protein
MMNMMRRTTFVAGALLIAASLVHVGLSAGQGGEPPAQGRGQGRGAGRGAAQPPANLPSAPTAVAIPSMSDEVTGPGTPFDSIPSLPPDHGLDRYGYEAREYFVSGTANGQPYRTRVVVRRPRDAARFSGLVLVEAMHGSGAAHMFEYTSIYTMSSGHAAVEILTTSPMPLQRHNEARYRDLQIANGQASDILAQVGALIRSGAPLGGLRVRKMVLAGTSQTAGILISYLPAHMVYRTPQMQRIYDGFMPTSNGSTIQEVDVPVVHVPTMHEASSPNITWRQDGDEPGRQYRVYEFAGMAHVDTRDSVRMKPNPCAQPLSRFPLQAYMSVALHHLLQWVDKGIVPPRADRLWIDRNEHNDGSPLALDEHGNPRGGIRTPYVDVPTARYGIRPAAASPAIPNPSEWIRLNGPNAANLMCGLSGYQIDFSREQLRKLYGSKTRYVGLVERRVAELEKGGWSLPVYRELILADAARVEF